MFYRAWDAAKRRPTHAIWIAAAIIAFGTVAHFLLACRAFWRSFESSEPMTPAQLSAALARSGPLLNVALVADAIGCVAAVLLGAWALSRKIRRLP